MIKYKLYNETKLDWEFVISDVYPTVLPINPEDVLRDGSQTVVEENVKFNDGTKVIATLPNYKSLRYNEIDRKTGELILNGFIYASKTFSLSYNAQINILALDETRNDPALIYPIQYNTIDDLDTYSVVDATDLHNMYLAALSTKKGIIDSGTVLKTEIRNAQTEAEVDAIIDNR
jgi:hypothetical protein